jgi:predicted deacetylase
MSMQNTAAGKSLADEALPMDKTPERDAFPSSPLPSSPAAHERALCVVIHDVADATLGDCDRVLAAIAEVAPVPLTFLAVPRYRHRRPTPAFEQWLSARSAHGDELALHGYTHVDDGAPRGWLDKLRREHYTRGEGEFWALPEADATARLEAGIDWFRRNHWPLHGFVAPAWLLGKGAWRALRQSPIAYTSTLRHIHLLKRPGRITSQSVVYSTSARWRRECSVAWARVVATTLRTNPVMRLELHPGDAEHSKVRRSWQRLLEQELRRREPLTVAQLTSRWRVAEQPGALAATGHGREALKED